MGLSNVQVSKLKVQNVGFSVQDSGFAIWIGV